MFWQAAASVAAVRKPLFGKQIQSNWKHFLPQPASSLSLEADEDCDEIRLIAASALIP